MTGWLRLTPPAPGEPPARPLAWMLLAGLFWFALLVPISSHRGEVALDDVFITYRYSQNFAAGNGFVFNPGERVFGTTAPGFGLLVGALAALTGLSIPWLGNGLTALAVLTVALAVFRAALAVERGPEAFVAGSLVVTSPYVWIHVGSEIPFALALLSVAAVLIDRRPGLAGAVAALAAWCRPDAVLGVGLLGLVQWWRRKKLPWAYGLVGAAVLALGLGLAYWWFGRILPSTLEAKRAQGALGAHFWRAGWGFWAEGFTAFRGYYAGTASLALIALGTAGLGLFARHGGPAGRILALFAVTLVFAYPLLGVPFYTWYPIPVVLALTFGASFAAGAIGRAIARFFGGGRLAGALALLAIVGLCGPMFWTLAQRSWRIVPFYGRDARYTLYRTTGEWIASHHQAGDGVAFVEVGTLAFFSQVPVRDLLGLVTPASLPYVRTGDYAGAFLLSPTTYFLDSNQLRGFVGKVTREPWFAAGYEEVRGFSSAGGKRELTLLRRRPDAVLPPPREPQQIDPKRR